MAPADAEVDAPVGWRCYALVLLGSSLIVSRWAKPGTFIASGDTGPFIRRGWGAEFTWSWNHSVSGAGSAAYDVARSFEFILIGACHALGQDEYTAQWLFYTCISGLVSAGVAFLAAAFVQHRTGVVAAGIFGICNGFFLTRLPNPLNVISVGSAALVTGLAIRVARGRRIPAPVAGLALLPTSFLSFNPPMVLVSYAWTMGGVPLLVLATLGRRPLLRLLGWMVRGAPFAVALNLFWLIPFAQSFTGGGGAQTNSQFTDPTNWSWSQINNTVPNVLSLTANWAWFKPQYLPFTPGLDTPWWYWVRYLLPALVILAPVLALPRLRRVTLVFLGAVAVVVILAKGLTEPLSGLNMQFYLHVPMFWLFREPMSKLGQLLVPFYGVLIAAAVQGVAHRLRAWRATGAAPWRPPALLRAAGRLLARRWRAHHPAGPALPAAQPPAGVLYRRIPAYRMAGVGAVGLLALTISFPYPVLTGGVIPDVRPSQPPAHVRVPDFWWNAAKIVDADHRPGRVLVLPLDDYYQMPTTWGFFGVDSIANLLLRHPVVQRKPDGYFSDSAGFSADVQQVETALMAGDLDAVPSLLSALQVGTVIMRHDLVRGLPNRTFVDDRVEAAALARVAGMHRWQAGTGPLELWRVGSGSSPPVRPYGRLVQAGTGPAETAAMIASLDPDTAVAVVGPPARPRASAAWAVPAVAAGSPSTDLTLQGGTYLLAQRARAAVVLRPLMDPARHRLVLRDPTRVLIDGRTVSTRPDLAVPVPRDVLVLTAGTRTVSLDGWGRPAGNPAMVSVGADTPLVAYAAARVPARLSPPSAVYDCNNYEPRPAAELGLSSTVSGGVVTVRALDHAACVRYGVLGARPGRTYRIRLEYRQVTGNRPQICVWQIGTEGCEPAPRAVLGTTWRPYELVVTVRPGSTGLEVILHGDVGLRYAPSTATQYRGVSVQGLDVTTRAAGWPRQVPPRQVRLAAGRHRLSVVGGHAGSALNPFEPVQDCFRYDDLDAAQAGLIGEVNGPDVVLGARVHMACVGASAPDFGNSSLYQLSYSARSVALRNPKVCLFSRGPDTCTKLPPGGPWKTWATVSAAVAPDPLAVETRLYLYGQRDFAGTESSRVEYRDVLLRPMASTSTVVLVRQPDRPVTTAPLAGWRRPDPAHYSAGTGPAAPAVVGLAEAYATGWHGPRGSRHLAVEGWMNAWVLPPGTTSTLRYRPAEVARKGLLVFPLAALATLAWIASHPYRLRRRARLRAAGRTLPQRLRGRLGRAGGRPARGGGRLDRAAAVARPARWRPGRWRPRAWRPMAWRPGWRRSGWRPGWLGWWRRW
jgi:arabinofuranan 3-O-arabinosyltransferase